MTTACSAATPRASARTVSSWSEAGWRRASSRAAEAQAIVDPRQQGLVRRHPHPGQRRPGGFPEHPAEGLEDDPCVQQAGMGARGRGPAARLPWAARHGLDVRRGSMGRTAGRGIARDRPVALDASVSGNALPEERIARHTVGPRSRRGSIAARITRRGLSRADASAGGGYIGADDAPRAASAIVRASSRGTSQWSARATRSAGRSPAGPRRRAASAPSPMVRLCAQMAYGPARSTFRSSCEWSPSQRAVLRMVDAVGAACVDTFQDVDSQLTLDEGVLGAAGPTDTARPGQPPAAAPALRARIGEDAAAVRRVSRPRRRAVMIPPRRSGPATRSSRSWARRARARAR